MNKPLVSVILGSYNRLNFLKLTLETIREELKNFSYEIIVVDGGSDDGTMNWLAQQKDVITIIQHNRGEWAGKKIERRSWGYFMNLGFKCAQGKYVCMLSDDCLVVPGAIKNGCELFEKELSFGKKIGAMAFYFRDWPKQTSYHVGYTLGDKLYVNHGLYLKQALEDVGYIDEETYFFYNGDGDLCLKIWQQGYECVPSPNSFIEHYPHANLNVIKTNHKQQGQDNSAYFKKWTGIFYDKKLHNIGKLEFKEFQDPFFTAEKFRTIHEGIVQKNPEILKVRSAALNGKIRELKFKVKRVWKKLF